MSAPVTLGSPAATAIDPPAARPPKTVEEAAKQFEALMIAQMLKQARGDQGGWLGGGDDAGTQTETGLAEEQFAQALARSGGLGLGASLVSSLSARAK
ncbi:MAG: flagellar biosynthesis protein FlgJ [Bryobacteraceae bacterium]